MQVAVLSSTEIINEIKSGNILLHDPDRDCTQNIQNCSVDITLGEHYYRSQDYRSVGVCDRIKTLNPWNNNHVRDYWGGVQSPRTIERETEATELGLKLGDKYIKLAPGETILGHTREFVGGRNHITTMIKARSSLGRSNVTICRDAGWGDIGYCNRWTLEITNNGSCNIILPVGCRIGQIVFFYTGKPVSQYDSKYQPFSNQEEMISKWSPEMLLPKAYLDK